MQKHFERSGSPFWTMVLAYEASFKIINDLKIFEDNNILMIIFM